MRWAQTRKWVSYQKVVLRVLEDHVDSLVLQNDLTQSDDVFMKQLSVELG
jgi:hypothetical protein